MNERKKKEREVKKSESRRGERRLFPYFLKIAQPQENFQNRKRICRDEGFVYNTRFCNLKDS